MSGRDGGPRGPVGPIIACDQLSFTTQIASPKDDVVEQLRENFILGNANSPLIMRLKRRHFVRSRSSLCRKAWKC